ncbi:septum formation initiator family protein [Streptomyces sp. NPDC001678]|uniref:FtsB family cell division protein n=1 Tax=Streptomyces sp. NPDC001678 TaxID=3364599 RepID=UPI0036916BEC
MSPAGRRGGRLVRLLPTGPAGAKRTPFVLLVVVLLGSGLISLLLLNSSLNQGSFELSRLQRTTTELTDEQQALQQDVDQLAAPDALERRARELGMIPGGSPAFLLPDGTVKGAPAPATTANPADPAAFAPPEPRGLPPLAPDPLVAPAATPGPPPAVLRGGDAPSPAAQAPVRPPADRRPADAPAPARPNPALPPAPVGGNPQQVR